MNTPHSLSDSRPGPACAAFEPLLPLAPHGLLEPDEAEQLQAHLAGCARCHARLAAYDRLDAALRQRFEQVALPPLHTEDIMKEIREREEQEQAAPLAPLPPTRRRVGHRPRLRRRALAETGFPHSRSRWSLARPRRAISWVAAVAAVLVIALLTTALVASHYSPGKHEITGKGSPTPGQQAAPPSGIYFTVFPASGSAGQSFLYAVNPADGSVRWRYPIPAGVDITQPVVDHGVLYFIAQYGAELAQGVNADKNAVYAVRASDGKELWHTPINYVADLLSLVNGVVYTGTAGGMVYALNASDGSIKWHITVGNTVDVEQVLDGVVYIDVYHVVSGGSVSGSVYALNASDGSQKWRFDLHGNGTVWAFDGLVAVLDTGTVQSTSGTTTTITIVHWLTVLNASDGSVKWRYPGDPSSVRDAFVEQNTVYVTLLGGSGKESPAVTLQALNASDGSLRWQKSYDTFNLLGPAQGSGNAKVYLTADNVIYALNAADGSVAWHAQIGANPYLALLAGGNLYAGAQLELYTFNADDGSALWHAQLADGAEISGASSQMVYGIAKSTDPQQHWLMRLFALDARTGQPLWHDDFTSSITAPTVA